MLVFDMGISFSAYRTTANVIHWQNDEMQREVNEKRKQGLRWLNAALLSSEREVRNFVLEKTDKGTGTVPLHRKYSRSAVV